MSASTSNLCRDSTCMKECKESACKPSCHGGNKSVGECSNINCSSNGRSCTTKDCNNMLTSSSEGTAKIQLSCIPLPLPEDLLNELVADARDYALLHGAGMRYRESYSVDTLSMVPFFLLPTPFPRRDFEKVYQLQPLINKLMHRVAHDHEFLEKCLANTIKVDDFTRKVWEVYVTVRTEGIKQPVSLGLLRCDVLLDTPSCGGATNGIGSLAVQDQSAQYLQDTSSRTSGTFISASSRGSPPSSLDLNCSQKDGNSSVPKTEGRSCSGLPPVSPVTTAQLLSTSSVLCCSVPKQVEVNTIASSFGALCDKITDLQKYVLNLMGRQDLISNMPPNDALKELCGGMIAAWDMYARQDAIILFIVEDVSYNICDQRFHEYEILDQRPGIRVVRRTLTDVHNHGQLDKEYRLWIQSREVAVVYFRCGYDPSGYHGPDEWAARLLIERSLAIKCPSVHYHLAGTKKVQQELAAPGALLPFLTEEEAKSVSELFTGLYSLDMGEDGDKSVAMALADPHAFVLKPQREGGGNNIYGEDIRTKLLSIGKSKQRDAYILMDRIRAPVQTNYLVSPQKGVALSSVTSELGIFGAILGSQTEIYLNKVCGHMLRSKLSTNNEIGVASGNGALDSVLLVD